VKRDKTRGQSKRKFDGKKEIPAKKKRSGSKSRYDSNGSSDVFSECKTCKDSGRPFRHSDKTCKFAPGGPWHNKSGEELRRLQKLFYENRKNKEASRSQTHRLEQMSNPRKRRRELHAEGENGSDDQIPLWQKENTYFAQQDSPPESRHEWVPLSFREVAEPMQSSDEIESEQESTSSSSDEALCRIRESALTRPLIPSDLSDRTLIPRASLNPLGEMAEDTPGVSGVFGNRSENNKLNDRSGNYCQRPSHERTSIF
jgi:hypothetical protein